MVCLVGFAVASLSYALVEKPAIDFGKRLTSITR